MQIGTAILEERLAVSSKIKCNLITQSNILLDIYQKSWKLCLQKNLCDDVYRRFVHNFQNLEEAKMSLSI